MEIFAECVPGIMQVFLDDFAVFGGVSNHLRHIRLCLQNGREARLSLNPAKCVLAVTSGMLLGHIVSKERIGSRQIQSNLRSPGTNQWKGTKQILRLVPMA